MIQDDDAVVVAAAKQGISPLVRRSLFVFVGLLGVGVVVLAVGFFLQLGRSNALANQVEQQHNELADVHGTLNQYAEGLRTVAAQVRELGGTPKVQPPPVTGPARPGGRGVLGTALTGGHLWITYDDGLTEDKGQVVGHNGAKGENGRGIASTAIVDGDLLLTYTGGSKEDVGRVVGRDGRGVASVDGSTGRLIITYTDGTTQDAGPLPVPRGIKHTEVRDCHLYVTYTDDSTEDAGSTCTTVTVAPSPTTTTATAPPSSPEATNARPPEKTTRRLVSTHTIGGP